VSAVLRLSDVRTPARLREAQQIEQIRRDCLDAGLNAHQIQHVLARARKSLRYQAEPAAAMCGVVQRAKANGLSAFTLLKGLQAVLRERLAGRSSATAYQAGVAAMRPARSGGAGEGGAA
jgi:hypothetical protein